MKLTEAQIVEVIATEYRTFGGHRPAEGNPIAQAMQGLPLVFAAGVSVAGVVHRVLELAALEFDVTEA